MNERFKELLIQVVGPSRLHGGEFALMGDKDVEKFGELIVRECAMLANEHLEESEGVHFGVGRAIEQHFGVE